jgi:hypothetical protein
MSCGDGAIPLPASREPPGGDAVKGEPDNARDMKAAVGFVSLLAVLASVAPASACACGVAIEADVAYEQALVSWDGRREAITVKLDFENAGKRAAVLFPVPSRPHVELVHTDPFKYLEEATHPVVPETDGGAGAQAGVDVVERRVIGAFDVAVLRADSRGSLTSWLKENDYRVPRAASQILERYVKRRWDFVAIKLAKGREGSLQPLRISFATREAVYPLELSRIARTTISLRLYVNSRSAVDATGVAGMRRVFDSPVDKLDPPPPSSVLKLLPEPHLTRLELTNAVPGAVESDVGIRAAGVAPGDDGGLPTVVWIAIAAGLLAAAATVFAWRGRAR